MHRARKSDPDPLFPLASPELRTRLLELGFEPRSSTPEELRAIIASEVALWAKVIRDSGAKIQ